MMNPSMMMDPSQYAGMAMLGQDEQQQQQPADPMSILTQLLQQAMAPQEQVEPSAEYTKQRQMEAIMRMGAEILGAETDNFGTALGKGGTAYSEMMSEADKDERRRIIMRQELEQRKASSAASTAGSLARMEQDQGNIDTGREIDEKNRVIARKEKVGDLEEGRVYNEGQDALKREQALDDQGTTQANAMARLERAAELDAEREKLKTDREKQEDIEISTTMKASGDMPLYASPASWEVYARIKTDKESYENRAANETSTGKQWRENVLSALKATAPQYWEMFESGDLKSIKDRFMADYPNLPEEDYAIDQQTGLPNGLVKKLDLSFGGAAPAAAVRPEPGDN